MTTKMTRRSQTPSPTNIDLINILRHRIDKNKRPSFITDMHNLYEKEPWLLQHVRHVSSVENVWFYFVTRKQSPVIKKTDALRPSRKVAESGRWKSTSVINYIENKDGVRVGSVKTISFKVNSETEKDGITTGWVMHEFVLDKPGFQELALCKIRFYPRKGNAQYAPRLTPIVIGLERQETHQDQGMEQWTGEVVSNLDQNILGQDSNNPILNGSWGSCGRFLGESSGQQQYHRRGRQATYLSLMEVQQQQCHNYFWGQETDPSHPAQAKQQWNGYPGLYSVQDSSSYGQQKNPNLGHMEQYEKTEPKKVPMMKNQALNEKHRWDEYSGHLPSQHISVNGSSEQHQSLSSCGKCLGESSGQKQHHSLGEQASYLSLMEVQPSAQAMEEKQQVNGYSGLYPSQPYDQYLRQNNNLLALRRLAAHQKHLSNLPLTQQQNKILGQATHSVQCSAQPYDQYNGQNNELPTVPMETQQEQNNELPTVPIKTEQEHDNIVKNSAAQLHLEAQDDVPLIDHTMEAQATDPPTDSQKHQELLGDDFFQGMDSEMADLPNDFCITDLAQQFEKIPIPYDLLF